MPSVKELRELAKENGIRGYSVMNKQGLLEACDALGNSLAKQSCQGCDSCQVTPAQTTVPAEPKPAKKKSKWNVFVKQYCNEHKCNATKVDKSKYKEFLETYKEDA